MQLRLKRPDVRVTSIHEWHDGEYLGVADEEVLIAAQREQLTLVTYDTQILSKLSFVFAYGAAFGGLVFVYDKTVAGNDFGALVRALLHLWDHVHASDWQNRLIYLAPPPDRNER